MEYVMHGDIGMLDEHEMTARICSTWLLHEPPAHALWSRPCQVNTHQSGEAAGRVKGPLERPRCVTKQQRQENESVLAVMPALATEKHRRRCGRMESGGAAGTNSLGSVRD